MVLIPYPIPEPDRTWLKLAGEDACRQGHKTKAQEIVQEILDGIAKKYGIEEETND